MYVLPMMWGEAWAGRILMLTTQAHDAHKTCQVRNMSTSYSCTYHSLSVVIVQKLLVILLRIDPRCMRRRASTPLHSQLAWVVAPCVLHMFVPLLGNEHKPLLGAISTTSAGFWLLGLGSS